MSFGITVWPLSGAVGAHALGACSARDSSNIDAGVNIGTIFGIYRVQNGSDGAVEDVLRPGKEMVAAG